MTNKFKISLLTTTIFFFLLSCDRTGMQPSDGPITPQAVYSADDPGNWAGKEEEHIPVVKISSDDGTGNVAVSVTLQNPSSAHYIEKIFIADKQGKPYSEVIFNNTGSGTVVASVSGPDGQPRQPDGEISGSVFSSGSGKTWQARFTMPVNSQTKREFAVYARCSQHDLWMAGL
jgi:desulfoferrodoxin (superoxide reductase-like protein)